MKHRHATALIVPAMTLLAASLGVTDAAAQDPRTQDRKVDSTEAATKGDYPPSRAVESRQLKGERLDERQLRSRQLKGERLDDRQLQSRQIKMQDPATLRTESRQIKNGPPDDGG